MHYSSPKAGNQVVEETDAAVSKCVIDCHSRGAADHTTRQGLWHVATWIGLQVS